MTGDTWNKTGLNSWVTVVCVCGRPLPFLAAMLLGRTLPHVICSTHLKNYTDSLILQVHEILVRQSRSLRAKGKVTKRHHKTSLLDVFSMNMGLLISLNLHFMVLRGGFCYPQPSHDKPTCFYRRSPDVSTCSHVPCRLIRHVVNAKQYFGKI